MTLPLGNRNINIAFFLVENYDHSPDAVHLFDVDTGQSFSSIMGSSEPQVCTSCHTKAGSGKTPHAVKSPRTEILDELSVLFRATLTQPAMILSFFSCELASLAAPRLALNGAAIALSQ